MKNTEWFYAKDGQQSGPVTWDGLESKARSGTLELDDLVWTEGMSEWQPARTRQGLFVAPVAEVAPSQSADAAMLGAGTNPALVQPSYGGYVPLGIDYYHGAGPNADACGGFWIRVGAYLIDGLIMGVANWILGTVLTAIFTASNPSHEAMIGLGMFINVCSIVTDWMYYAMMESSAGGATVGKIVCGLRVVNLNGERIGFGQATGRYFGKMLSAFILCIGFMMVGWTERKQGLHDILAGTLVIQR